jgi:hypothetical protein
LVAVGRRVSVGARVRAPPAVGVALVAYPWGRRCTQIGVRGKISSELSVVADILLLLPKFAASSLDLDTPGDRVAHQCR